MRKIRVLLPAIGSIAAACSLAIATGSVAGAATSTDPTHVSVSDPYAPTDCGLAGTAHAERPTNEPHEPTIAVNPMNANNVVVSYIVDGYVTNLVRTSLDGGRTWTTVQPAACGAATTGTADPSLAFSSDGKSLYLVGLAQGGTPSTDLVVVNVSRDGGITWGQTTELSPRDGLRTDMPNVTTDRRDPNTAYVSFERHDIEGIGSKGVTSTLYFEVTNDGGKTWSYTADQGAGQGPTIVYRPPAQQVVTSPRVFTSTDGALVNIFERENAVALAAEDNVVLASRSLDGGRTWSTPYRITNRTAGPGTETGSSGMNPSGPQCALSTLHQATASANGTLYVSTLQDGRTPPIATDGSDTRLNTSLVLLRSNDGITWTQISSIAAPTAIGMTTLAVSPDGTIGMTYYEIEGTTCPPQPPTPTDLWFARSGDKGHSWSISQVAGGFDATADCNFPGPEQSCSLGDYDGLAADPAHGFDATFELTGSYVYNGGNSDIFYRRLTS
jgi:hypothetical protein